MIILNLTKELSFIMMFAEKIKLESQMLRLFWPKKLSLDGNTLKYRSSGIPQSQILFFSKPRERLYGLNI